MEISIIVPILNEEKRISPFYFRLKKSFGSRVGDNLIERNNEKSPKFPCVEVKNE